MIAIGGVIWFVFSANKPKEPESFEQQAGRILRNGKEAADTARQTTETLNRIAESHSLTAPDKAWIESQLSKSSDSTRNLMMPLLVEVHKRVPDARKWAEDLISSEAKKAADGAGRKLWTEAEKAVKSAHP